MSVDLQEALKAHNRGASQSLQRAKRPKATKPKEPKEAKAAKAKRGCGLLSAGFRGPKTSESFSQQGRARRSVRVPSSPFTA